MSKALTAAEIELAKLRRENELLWQAGARQAAAIARVRALAEQWAGLPDRTYSAPGAASELLAALEDVSVDPFALAKAIRKGEADDQLPDYEVLTGWLQRVPVTWLPALLGYVVTHCVVRNVFQPGKMVPYCERAELLANDPTSILRKD